MTYMDENLHGGHRQRLLEKFYKSPDSFLEHELVELFLFPLLPRKDTNALAHRLLKTFGSISRIFSATPEELTVVDGVGKAIATKIAVYGKIFSEIYKRERQTSKSKVYSFNSHKDYFIHMFDDPTKESMFILLLDAHYGKITTLSFCDYEPNKVSIQLSALAKAVAINRPSNAIVVHNHPSGNVNPSRDDDVSTAKINLVCAMHGVTLVDHVITSTTTAYSYFLDGRLQYIKDSFNVEDLMKTIEGIKL